MYNIVRFCPGRKNCQGEFMVYPSFPAIWRRSTRETRRMCGEVNDWRLKMRFAIVESGGKQFRAVEGSTIDVDRLPVEAGKKFDLSRVLLMADGDEVMVGTPTLSGIHVKATVVDHLKGPKLTSFRYRPKKRIRVKGGHRPQFTRLMIDFIGKPGEERKVEKAEKPAARKEAGAKKSSKGVKQARSPKKESAASSPKKKTGKAPARKTTAKKSESKK
jgi:large subunit ribosomal protein L21